MFSASSSSKNNYSISFSKDQIQLNGGCNKFTLPYTITEKTIQTGQSQSTRMVCSNDDDGLYSTSFQKFSQYTLLLQNGEIKFNIFDQNNKSVLELNKKYVPNNSSLISDKKILQIQPLPVKISTGI